MVRTWLAVDCRLRRISGSSEASRRLAGLPARLRSRAGELARFAVQRFPLAYIAEDGFDTLRDYANSDRGKSSFREFLDKKSEPIKALRALTDNITDDAPAVLHPIPKLEFTPEICEAIYPDERESVEFGLEIGRFLIWGSLSLAAGFVNSDEPAGEAVRRFMADRAH